MDFYRKLLEDLGNAAKEYYYWHKEAKRLKSNTKATKKSPHHKRQIYYAEAERDNNYRFIPQKSKRKKYRQSDKYKNAITLLHMNREHRKAQGKKNAE